MAPPPAAGARRAAVAPSAPPMPPPAKKVWQEPSPCPGQQAVRVQVWEAPRKPQSPQVWDVPRKPQSSEGEQPRELGQRWSFFTPLAVLACLAVMGVELWQNAQGVDFSKPRTDDCYYRVTVRNESFCTATWRENPLFGPTTQVLSDMGAVHGGSIVQKGEAWRLLTGMWLHGGAVHLALNMVALLWVGRQLEHFHGAVRVGAMYLLSGLFGSLGTAIFMPRILSVGASGAIFGVIGAAVGDVFMNWDCQPTPIRSLLVLSLLAALQLLLGTMPMVDNFAHTFGLAMGFVSSLCLLDRLNKRPHCLATCSRRFFRTVAACCVFLALVAGFAVLYGIGGTDANELCPECSMISCKEFPWGCDPNRKHSCWWTCDQSQLLGCSGTGSWKGSKTNGTVTLHCPIHGGVDLDVAPVDVTYWDKELLSQLCKDHCPHA